MAWQSVVNVIIISGLMFLTQSRGQTGSRNSRNFTGRKLTLPSSWNVGKTTTSSTTKTTPRPTIPRVSVRPGLPPQFPTPTADLSSTCSFPEQLRGMWLSNNGHVFQFEDTVVKIKLPTGNVQGRCHNMTTDNIDTEGWQDLYDETRAQREEPPRETTAFRFVLIEEHPSFKAKFPRYTSLTCMDVRVVTGSVLRVAERIAKIYEFQLGEEDTSFDAVCQSVPHPSTYSVLVRKDADVEPIQCPAIFHGQFKYVVNKGEGNKCVKGSLLDVCTDRTMFIFDYKKCGDIQASSLAGQVHCLDTWSAANGVQYLYVYDKADYDIGYEDLALFSKFTCYVFSYREVTGVTRIYSTSRMRTCVANQNSTHPDNLGTYTEFTLNTPCSSSLRLSWNLLNSVIWTGLFTGVIVYTRF